MQKFTLSALLIAAAATATATAQSPLTTTFASGTIGTVGGAVYFQLACTDPAGVTIPRFDLHFADTAGTNGSIDVYLKCGGYLPHTSFNWIQVDAAQVTAAGLGQPTECLLTNGLQLSDGQTVGVAIVANGLAHATTSLPFLPLVYATAELTLDTGLISATPFTGTAEFPHIVNTNVHYTSGGTGPALACARPVGTNCFGMSLQPVVRPVLGTPPITFRVTTTDIPPSTGFSLHAAIVGMSQQNAALDGFGMTGCTWSATGDQVAIVPLILLPSSFTWFPFGFGGIPNDPTLAGCRFYVQSAVFGTTVNGAFGDGAVASNGLEFTLGTL